jgi:hypothetical protein
MNKISLSHIKELLRSQLVAIFLLLSYSACQLYGQDKRLSENALQTSSSSESILANDLDGWEVVFHENFSNTPLGAEPESLFILDGAYAVQASSSGQRVLTLPGTPTGDYGVLFGPKIKDKAVELRFSFYASPRGRRMPSIAASVGGVRGLRLRLNPAARTLIFTLDEIVLKQIPLEWKGEQWWTVRLRVVPSIGTHVMCKLWPSSEIETVDWPVDETFKVEHKSGKCALWGFPYAGTEILFDEIIVLSK